MNANNKTTDIRPEELTLFSRGLESAAIQHYRERFPQFTVRVSNDLIRREFLRELTKRNPREA